MSNKLNRQKLLNEVVFNFICMRKGFLRHSPNEKSDLPFAQGEALFAISFKGKMTVGELAEFLTITPSAATQLSEALVNLKLLKREPSSTDRRVTYLNLTIKGEKFIEKKRQHKMQMISQTLSGLSDEELVVLNGLLQKISGSNIKKERV